MNAATKADQRRCARARRARLDRDARARASSQIRSHLAPHLESYGDVALAGYWPLGDEVDLRPLLSEWHAAGHLVLLPRVVRQGEPLRFHRWTPATKLELAAFGMSEPPRDAPTHDPDVVLVPALAIDADGYRLGYGGGFYDRTLALLRPLAVIGVAFAIQLVDRLPHDGFDQRLTHVVTEDGLRSFARAPA